MIDKDIIVEGQIGLRDRHSTKCILRLKVYQSLLSSASQKTGSNTYIRGYSLPAITILNSSCARIRIISSFKNKQSLLSFHQYYMTIPYQDS